MFDIPGAIRAVADLISKVLDKAAPDSAEASARGLNKVKAKASETAKKIRTNQKKRK